MTSSNKAVVLLSGGLDSATVLAMAVNQGYQCFALSFDYGQRHCAELQAAERVAGSFAGVVHKTIQLDLAAFGGSALTDSAIDVPDAEPDSESIPITYVPARNTVFLSLALAWAEVLQADTIFIGVNAVDYSGYPDCRPDFIRAFENVANLGTKAGVEAAAAGQTALSIRTPLVDLSKAEIIRAGIGLGVDYSLTVSCYQPDPQGRACGRCDSCYLRRQGFSNAEVADPTRYMADS